MLLSEGAQGRQDQLLQSKIIYIQNISNGFQDMITLRIQIDNNISEGRVICDVQYHRNLFNKNKNSLY